MIVDRGGHVRGGMGHHRGMVHVWGRMSHIRGSVGHIGGGVGHIGGGMGHIRGSMGYVGGGVGSVGWGVGYDWGMVGYGLNDGGSEGGLADDRVESVDGIGGVVDGAPGAIGLGQGVLAGHDISVTGLVLVLVVSGDGVLDIIRE